MCDWPSVGRHIPRRARSLGTATQATHRSHFGQEAEERESTFVRQNRSCALSLLWLGNRDSSP